MITISTVFEPVQYVLVCGGRHYDDAERVDSVLQQWPMETLLHGGATGADALGAAWATARGIRTICVKADWVTHGRAAGPIRNQEMLKLLLSAPGSVVIAFPGGTGTNDMITRALRAGVQVYEVRGSSQASGEVDPAVAPE